MVKTALFLLLFLTNSITTLHCLRDPFCFGTPKKEINKLPVQEVPLKENLGAWDITHHEGNCLIIKNAEGQIRKIELISFLNN